MDRQERDRLRKLCVGQRDPVQRLLDALDQAEARVRALEEDLRQWTARFDVSPIGAVAEWNAMDAAVMACARALEWVESTGEIIDRDQFIDAAKGALGNCERIRAQHEEAAARSALSPAAEGGRNG